MAKKKIKKVIVQQEKKVETLSLLERSNRENENGAGKGAKKREICRMAFSIWFAIPVRFRGAPQNIIETLGISDPDTLELIGIKNQKEFAEKFNVGEPTLSDCLIVTGKPN